MKILITGDLVVNQQYNSSIQIDKDLIALFQQSDYNIVNLEAPLTDNTSKILKTGPHLKANRESTLQILKILNVDVVTLANNHVLDYDEQGVEDTLKFCKENEIKSVGAGMNLGEASKTLFIDSTEGKIAIVNFAENEWASAKETTAGANPMDIIDNTHQIEEAKKHANFVIVIVHGGHEYYNLPSPRMQKQYRFYAERGADIVIGHHPHCISGHEIYNTIPIYYSLGNFLFTNNNPIDDWYLGLVLEVDLQNNKLQTQLFPVKQERQTFQLNLLAGQEKINVLKRIEQYNLIISNSNNILLNNEWHKYVESRKNNLLNYWSFNAFIQSRYIRAFLNRLNIKFINKNALALYLNLMRCEAHNDLSKEVIIKYLEE